MLIIGAVLAIIANLIIYYFFGNILVTKKDGFKNPILTLACGFFLYFSLFALFALPIMMTYRPLSLLTKCWSIFAGIVIVFSIIFKRKNIIDDFGIVVNSIKNHRVAAIVIGLAILIQVFCIVLSYDFTLDAAYYVANVTTSVDTNMINVYDPFTGAWQDHFELRYAFATYSINDAVICQLTHLPALVQTKTIMASTVALLVDFVYLGIGKTLIKEDDDKKISIFMISVIWINYSFVTIYTASNFLMTRTYEGKAIVGNLTLTLIFWLFIKYAEEETPALFWIMLFAASFGSTTITSSANMLIPAELSVLFVPYILRNKKWSDIVKYVIMVMPGLIMLMVYVLYVKGYFAIHTYPRY